MADFLSPAWMDQVEAAAPAIDPAVSFTLEQVVLDGPGGDVRYTIGIAGGGLTMRPGTGDEKPDITICVPYPVGVGLATGQITVHDALLDGAIKVSGDLERLQQATAALAAIAEAMGAVQELTAYPR